MLLIARFVPALDSSWDAADAGDISWYAVIIINTNQFQLVAKYVSSRLLFHQVAHLIIDTK